MIKKLSAIETDDPNLPALVRELQTEGQEILELPFGNPTLTEAQAAGWDKNTAAADVFARLMEPHIVEAKATGAVSYDDICDYLNERQIFTRSGYAWTKGTLYPVVQRIGRLKTVTAS